MTWKLRERGDTGGTVRLEYLCPVHGRFEADVLRAASPDAMCCPAIVERPHYCAEPPCDDCGNIYHHCEEMSPWSPTGVTGRVKQGEVIQGKIPEYPGEQHVMSTQALADGMPLAEFKARRAKVHRDIALDRVRKLRAR